MRDADHVTTQESDHRVTLKQPLQLPSDTSSWTAERDGMCVCLVSSRWTHLISFLNVDDYSIRILNYKYIYININKTCNS